MLLRPRQKELVSRAVYALHHHDNTLCVAPTGCHAKGTLILMANGSLKKVEDIVPRDQLMGPDSKPRNVLSLCRGKGQMFRITPHKGNAFVVNEDHILSLQKTKQSKDDINNVVNLSVREYLYRSKYFKHLHKLYRTPVDFPRSQTPLPLDPYFFGRLLADASFISRSLVIYTRQDDLAYFQHKAAEFNLTAKWVSCKSPETLALRLSGEKWAHNPLVTLLRRMGVFDQTAQEKFIPDAYKIASREERSEVLAGLLDGDGSVDKTSHHFGSASPRMAEDVAFIARSLGFNCTPRCKRVGPFQYYTLMINGDFSDIPLRLKIPPKRKQIKSVLRTGFKIEREGIDDFFGFCLDGDNLYVMGDFTVTHNSGKTIMLSAVAAEFLKHPGRKACILAHRDELTSQNRDKFQRVNPHLTTGVFDASEKSWEGSATFAMVQTLSRETNIETLPKLDMLVIDEAHHARAETYLRVIEHAKNLNPALKLLGMTATANRGDKRGLRPIFSNVCDQITIEELVTSGHLVAPKTFIIDVGIQEALKHLKKKRTGDYDEGEVSSIMNTFPVNEAVVQTWKEKAGDRQTVVFCSTIQHACDVRQAFIDAGVATVMVHGEMSDREREQTLLAYTSGAARVIVNVAVLTEGWDDPPTSCVILLRLSSYKSTMIQMIGRGLRIASPDQYPSVNKVDCIVLDFGISTFFHGSLEDQINLVGRRQKQTGEAPAKQCPECNAEVPVAVHECPLCGYDFTAAKKEEQESRKPLTREEFVMQEIEMIRKRSPFMWFEPGDRKQSSLANGFNVWSGIFYHKGQWVALGAFYKQPARILAKGQQNVCLSAANDFMNLYESEDTAYKTREWLTLPPSDKQIKCLQQYLPERLNDPHLTRYTANIYVTRKFNNANIQRALKEAADD